MAAAKTAPPTPAPPTPVPPTPAPQPTAEVVFTVRLFGVQWLDMASNAVMQNALRRGVAAATVTPVGGTSITQIRKRANKQGVNIDVAVDVPSSMAISVFKADVSAPQFVFQLTKQLAKQNLRVDARSLSISKPAVLHLGRASTSTAGATASTKVAAAMAGAQQLAWIQTHTGLAVAIAFGAPFCAVGLFLALRKVISEEGAAKTAPQSGEQEMQSPNKPYHTSYAHIDEANRGLAQDLAHHNVGTSPTAAAAHHPHVQQLKKESFQNYADAWDIPSVRDDELV